MTWEMFFEHLTWPQAFLGAVVVVALTYTVLTLGKAIWELFSDW